ncbi:multiple myeloma tumor-associated 2 -like protein [Brachionus plicatilis]|uniref:Multiple myeloma tumor-associated 2-like protein n=1 Tax=Brachionus plicatilis TaxID=10195 RepID=A0A3M7R9B7_BRAPC|nr:multiple myeloma tumor-associated 2 -like protein [Brachionus plicatilis]
MYHPTRGGVRGGRDQFTWESVKTDKDRECYLGHSLMAPVGRWQEGKDIMWYSKENQKDAKEKAERTEFLQAKELEEQALMAALGYRIVKKEKKEDENRTLRNYDEQKEDKESFKKYNEKSIAKGPQSFEFEDKNELDKMLVRLLDKFGRDAVFEALGGSKDKKKKKEKKKSKKKSHHSTSESDTESDDSRSKKRRKYRNKSIERSKKRRSRSRSRSSLSSSDFY